MATPTARVLFLANSEHGQTNIILALTHELLLRGDIDVHVGSFPALEKRVDKLLKDNCEHYESTYASRIHFHPVRGPSNTDVFIRTGKRGAFHPPGYKGSILGFKSLIEDIWGWNEAEYVDVYESCREIIEKVDPSVIVVDFFFLQGRDAAHNTGHSAVLMNTTSLSHIVLGLQKNAAWAWKYPLPGTGFPYPLPLHLIISNTMAVLKIAKIYHGSGRRRDIREWRIRHNIKGRFPFADAWRPDRIHLSPALKELDWPFDVPDNVIPCGPILLPCASVQTQDAALNNWLHKGPTILVNLGTLYAPDPAVALEISTGLKAFLDSWKDKSVQVLWKLPKHPHDHDEVYTESIKPLEAESKAGRVSIKPWFDVEPMAMLETGQVILSIHHGGANSWYEAIQTGVPHVVLPAWQDCYENAARAEWLGIGVYGNKSVAPRVESQELAKAIEKVMRRRRSYTNRAAYFKTLCRKQGRVIASDRIVDLAKNPEKLKFLVPGVSAEDLQGDFEVIKNGSRRTLETTKKPSKLSSSQSLLDRTVQVLIVLVSSNAWFLFPLFGYSLLLIPRVRVIAFAYILYIKFLAKVHKTGSMWYRNDRFRKSWVWKGYAAYFPLSLYRSSKLTPQKKYIFGYHPHGVAFRGAVGSLAADGAGFSELFPGITNTFLMKDEAFQAPLLREYLLTIGLSGVSRRSCIKHLTSGGHDGRGMGRAITIAVGGSKEYAITRPGTIEVVVKIRQGFVRVAVETGADLVPVLAFGENELFDRTNVNGSWVTSTIAWLWEAVVRHKVAFSTGRFNIFCPYRKPLHVVVGDPISVTQQRTNPDEAYIAKLHAQYVEGLTKIWDDWKGVFEPSGSVKFEIVQ